MLLSVSWSLNTSIILFVSAAIVVGICGVMVTRKAEALARQTGLGQAIMGAVFLGAMTSLSGLITSMTAAYEGHPQLSVSNAVGGIAVQTTFLAVADIWYRKSNLEHAAASETNLVQASLLVVLLCFPLVAAFTPDTTVLGVHPVSVLLIAAYLFGMNLVSGAHKTPMWRPRLTSKTQPEEKPGRRGSQEDMLAEWARFAALSVVVVCAGWVIAEAGLSIVRQTEITESILGTLVTATTTSVPEAVIALVAVRRGALTLAVGDIIGGNTFDVLFLAFSDLVYRDGSIYHAVSSAQSFWLALSLLMAAILMLGLVRREEHGIGNIGFESFLVLVIYLGGIFVLIYG